MSSEPSVPAPSDPPADHPTSHAQDPDIGLTRAGALWTALILGFLLLIVLLIFILQNWHPARIAFLSWEQELPVGIALLFAAVAGGLLTVAVGAVRMVQLRRAAKRSAKALR